MNEETKLTLRINRKLIAFAKFYSTAHEKSISKMVSEYFILLAEQTPVQHQAIVKAETPITKSLIGVLRKQKISEKDYKKYLMDKYL